MRRRDVFALAPVGILVAGIQPGPSNGDHHLPGVVLQTRLKAAEGQTARLIAFLRANWLVMDRVAIDRGLFTHAVLHRVHDDLETDLIMEVGYVDPASYEAVAPAFEAIRAAHTTVLIDGLGFRDLGRVVGERRLTPIAGA